MTISAIGDHQVFFIANPHGVVLDRTFHGSASSLPVSRGELWYADLIDSDRIAQDWETFCGSRGQVFQTVTSYSNSLNSQEPIPLTVTLKRLPTGSDEVLSGSILYHEPPTNEWQWSMILDRLAAMTQPSSWGHWLYFPEKNRIKIGEGWRTTLNHKELGDEISIDQLFELINPADARRFRDALSATVSGESCSFDEQFRIRCGEGLYRWTNCWGLAVERSGSGQALRIIGFSADLNRLRFQREFLSSGGTLLEHVQESVIATDLDGIIWFWGKGAERLYGWRSDEVLGRPVYVIVPAGGKEREAQRMKQVYETGAWKGRYEQVRKNGTRFTAETYIALIRNNQGDPIGIVGIDHDISEEAESQRQIAHLQAQLSNVGWMNVRGEILAGISHEINQPLYAIQNFAAAARKHLERDDRAKCLSLIDKVSREVERANCISESMRDFARKSELELTTKNIHEVIESCSPFANLYAQSLGINLKIDLEAEKSIVSCNELHLQQAILNLVRNACEALAGCQLEDAALVTISTWNNSYLLFIDIEDNGCGIPQENRDKIFDHFFSTKQQGTGVGLPLCRSVISAHGGELQLASTSKQGTVFRISLPLQST